MAESNTSRWVVLLQKAPRGPLNREEVRALIDQGLLRMNDLAMEIPAAAEGAGKSDWKLLWQFPEFNRRTGERRKADGEAAPTPAATPSVARQKTDRRGPEISPEEQKRRILENLPAEIAAIDPSDLALRSMKTTARQATEEDSSPSTPVERAPVEAPRWRFLVTIAGGAVSAVLAVGLLATRTPTPETSPSRTNASTNTSTRPGLPVPADDRAALARAQRSLIRPVRRPNNGLPTGAELRPFDAAALRRASPPQPAVSPVAQRPDDSADSEYVAPVRRPRVVRPGAPIPADRLVEEGDENAEDTGRNTNTRRRPRTSRATSSDEDNGGDSSEPVEDFDAENSDDY